jgi:hypothetical protein
VRLPDQVEHGGNRGSLAICVQVRTEEPVRFHLEAGLLVQLSLQRLDGLFALFEESAGRVPESGVRLEGSSRKQDTPLVVDDDRGDGRDRVRVVDRSARRTGHPPGIAVERSRAARAVLPAGEERHGQYRIRRCLPDMSRRASPSSPE